MGPHKAAAGFKFEHALMFDGLIFLFTLAVSILDFRFWNLLKFRPLEGSCRMELIKFEHPQGQDICC